MCVYGNRVTLCACAVIHPFVHVLRKKATLLTLITIKIQVYYLDIGVCVCVCYLVLLLSQKVVDSGMQSVTDL